MKAIEVVEGKAVLNEAEKPVVGLNEILIKIKSTAVNRADLMQKKGLYPPPPGASEILGLECSGIVDEIGKNVTSRKVGEEVCALLAGGGYAEYVACPEFQAIPKPANLNWAESSSIPEVYATCWLNLFIEGNLTNNNRSLNLAEFTKDVVAIYYPAGFQSVAIRYKNSLQENTKIHAMTENVIETCHNGVVSWEKNSVVNPVLIQGKDDHEKTIERWKILEDFFKLKKINYMKINSIDGNILSKVVNLIYFLDYSTIYSAILNNTDPTLVNSIDYIKSKLI